MESIHELSSVAPLAEFDLWGVPPTQLTVEKDVEVEVRPLSVVDMKSPINFVFTTAADEYIKLDSLYLYWKFQATLAKSNKEAITEEDWKKVNLCTYT